MVSCDSDATYGSLALGGIQCGIGLWQWWTLSFMATFVDELVATPSLPAIASECLEEDAMQTESESPGVCHQSGQSGSGRKVDGLRLTLMAEWRAVILTADEKSTAGTQIAGLTDIEAVEVLLNVFQQAIPQHAGLPSLARSLWFWWQGGTAQ